VQCRYESETPIAITHRIIKAAYTLVGRC